MSEEGKKDGVETPEVEEVKPDPVTGKFPESISSKQYIATKESLGRKLDAEREKVKSLEEQLKNAPNAEEATRIKEERDGLKTKLQEKEEEATKASEKSVSEMKEILKKANVPEEKLEGASEAELKRLVDVLGGIKPKSLPDLSGGGGGGGAVATGSPMELARQAYANPKK